MSKEGVSFKNRDRFIQLGIAISTLRKLRGMSQDQLAEKANMSRSHLSAIEAPRHDRSHGLFRAIECSARKPSGFVVRWQLTHQKLKVTLALYLTGFQQILH